MSEVRHASLVREASHDRSRARWVGEQVRVYGIYWLSGRTTNTPQWWCIRVHEEGGQSTGNIFGFVPFPTSATGTTMATESREAIHIWHENGDKWGPTAWTTAASCGLP